MRRIKSFQGMTAVVTGGSSGIGLAICKALIKEGAQVVIVARDPDKVSSQEIGGRALFLKADVTEIGSLREASAKVPASGIDLLVNCAGISHPGRFLETDHAVIRRTIETNLLGTMNSCHAFGPLVREGGHIANIGSIAGILGFYGYGAYSASKFGVMGFSEALRMEMKQRGIGVSVILPPDTRTPQLEYEEKLKPPETKRITGMINPRSPEWVAGEVLGAIKARRFVAVLTASGKAAHIASRFIPSLTRWYIDRKVSI